MIKKFISILLVFSFAFSILTIFSSASDETEKDALINEGEAKGFGKFIDVEKYVENAGKPSFDKFSLIAIDIPYLSKIDEGFTDIDGNIIYNYQWRIPLYFYNPSCESFDCSEYTMILGDGYARVKDFDDVNFEGYTITCSQEPGYSSIDDMFISASIIGTFDSSDDLKNQFYEISEVYVGGYKFNVNQTIGFSDIDSTIEFSSPLSDLSVFTNTDKGELLKKFPFNENDTPHIAYFYESDYNSDNFNYYLYLYDPSNKLGGNGVSVEFFYDNYYQDFNFDYLCTEEQIVKYRMRDPIKISSGVIRDYYISNVSNFSFNLDTETHYQFSDSPLINVNNGIFQGDYSEYKLIGEFQQGDELLVSVEQNNFDSFELYVDYGAVERKSSHSFLITVSDYTLILNLTFKGITDFPFRGSAVIMPVVTIPGDEENKVISLEAKSTNLKHIETSYFSPEQAALLSETTSDSLYSKVKSDDKLSITVGNTFYRLDSSSKGNCYYQTLTSVYFTLPAELLSLEDTNVINDKWVSSIDVNYSHAMLVPSLVTSNEEWYNSLSFVNIGGNKINHFIWPTGYNSILSNVSTYNSRYDCDFLFGDGNFENLNVSVVPGKQYDCVQAVIFQEGFGEGSAVNSDILLNYYNTRPFHESDFKPFIGSFKIDESKTLSSYHDATFETVCKDFGFFNALWFKWFGTKQEIDETIKDIPVLQTVYPSDISDDLSLTEADFCSKYYIDDSEYEEIKNAFSSALSKNEAFVFLRFDTYDYYFSQAYNLFSRGSVHASIPLENVYVFQEKIYKDFDIVSMTVSNDFETEIYDVSMQPLIFTNNITYEEPINPEDFITPGEAVIDGVKDAFKEGFNFWQRIEAILALIPTVALCILIIFIVSKIIKRKKNE